MQSNKPINMSSDGIWESILKNTELMSIDKNARILDCASGQGFFSQKLYELGFTNIYSGDIDENNFLLDKEYFHFKKTNLNQQVPYDTGYFDVVISLETIEHVENPWHTLTELTRTLRTGGMMIISTPCVDNVFSRFWYLLTGGLFAFDDNGYMHSGHITILPKFQLIRMFKKCGLEISSSFVNRIKIPFLPFSIPLTSVRFFGEISIFSIYKK